MVSLTNYWRLIYCTKWNSGTPLSNHSPSIRCGFRQGRTVSKFGQLVYLKGQVQLQTELVKETVELQSLFKLEDVSFSYDDRPILKSLHLDIKKGEKIAIVGKNGAGKSNSSQGLK